MHFIPILFFLLFSTSTFSEDINSLAYSAPDQIVALTQESSKIAKVINPLSGQPCLQQTDLIAKGAQDVVLRRIFISQHRDWYANQTLLMRKGLIPPQSDIESGWIIFPHTHLDRMTTVKRKHHKTEMIKNEVRIIEQNGVALTFSLGSNGKAELVDKPYGICNSHSLEEMPSGQYDPRNIKIIKKPESIEVYSPNGSIYHYKQYFAKTFNDHDQHIETNKAHYLLSKEILPNGKILRYRYNKERELMHVESTDPKERYIYASMEIDSSSRQTTSKFLTNTGICASYKQNTPKRKPAQSHENSKTLNLLSIQSANTPFYEHETISLQKSLLNSYSGQRNLFTCQYAESGEHYSKNKRVSKLLLPTANLEFQTAYEFNYNPPLVGEKSGTTRVNNHDGSYIIYEYSAQLLLTGIKYFDVQSVLKKKKDFNWTDNHWLSSLSVQDGNGDVLYTKTYQYDNYGNPVLEVFTADITGKGVEQTSTTRKFSPDGRHLLLEEKNDEGRVLSFQYLPNTHLLTVKLTKQNDVILRREFYEYDDCYNLIKKIEDNGIAETAENLLGVSQRNITSYILRNQAPFLHLPEWIEEKYLEDGVEKSLKRTHLAYDAHGHICEEKIYGADGLLSHTLSKSYDDRGYLIAESNAIGQQAVYSYDSKGRCVFATNFSKTLQKKMDYDQRDRLIKMEEAGCDGIVHSTTFAYDLNDQLIRKRDFLQNVTEYIYDPLCHKITKTAHPSIEDHNGQKISVLTYSSYDAFGRELSTTDANGNTTLFRYSGHVLPVETVYASGCREFFSYTKRGLLKEHVDQEGLTTSYTYDIFGRVLSKIFSLSNKEIAREDFGYDSFNLIEKTDREGLKTSYRYDGAGRLVAEETSHKTICYSYDPLGYIATITHSNGNNTLFTHYKKDQLGRILEETRTDSKKSILSKVTYAYHADGNISTITRNINDVDAIESFVYDSFQRQLKAVDAFGNQITTHYNEYALNSIEQNVCQITTTDAKNHSTIKTHDSHGRVVQEDVVDLEKQLVKSQKTTYDPNGNLTFKKNLIFQNGQYQKTIETQYCYNAHNQVSHLIRAVNCPNSRTTSYAYTPKGKIAAKTKPNGTVLSYDYHPLGYLKTITAGDKFKLSYDYNLLGRLIHATDEINGISVQRTLDPFGNILTEKLSTGLTIHKTYDALDRPLSVELPEGGRILYTYDPLFLRTVTRTSSSEEVLYEHHYSNYDSSGYLKQETMIGGLGDVNHVTDKKGRKTSIASPYFQESYTYDEVDNIVGISRDGCEIAYHYDPLNQLTREAENTYVYDSNFNRTEENGLKRLSNELDELISTNNAQCVYDLNGNLISKTTPNDTLTFTYDPLDRLIQVETKTKQVEMLYDPLGRRVRKTTHEKSNSTQRGEHYLYDGEHDIGTFSFEGIPLHLRVLGLDHYNNTPSTIAIEIGTKAFAPIQDFQGNIRKLICPLTRKTIAEYRFNAFGCPTLTDENLFNPWRYASKRFDPETNLINFGKRFYDAELSQWITIDPAGFIDGMNLYAYVKNNPYRYTDPNGLFVLPLICFAMPALCEISFAGVVTWISAEAVVGAVVGAALGIGVYQLDKALDRNEYDITMYNEALAEETETKEEKKKRFTRTDPIDLEEQLALEEAKGADGKPVMEGKLNDPKYPESKWKKQAHSHAHPNGTRTEVHYWEEIKTGHRQDFKFKDDDNLKSRIYKK